MRALERRSAGADSVEGSPGEFESRLCPIRTQVPPLPGSLSASPSLRSLPTSSPTTAIQIYNPNNLISRSSPPASALAPPTPSLSISFCTREQGCQPGARRREWGGWWWLASEATIPGIFVCLWRSQVRLFLPSAEPVASPGISLLK